MIKFNLKTVKAPICLEALGIAELNYLDEVVYGPSDLIPVELANHVLRMAPKTEDRIGLTFAIRHRIETRSIPIAAKKPWGQRGYAKKKTVTHNNPALASDGNYFTSQHPG